MSTQPGSVGGVELRHVGFAGAFVAGVAFVLPGQLLSMILFDSIGLDGVAPDLVFMALVPAVAVSVVPGVVARRFYPRRRALLLTSVAFLGYLAVAASLIRFYGVCGGPGC